jgi:D-glycero-alpha-D-manno-heptose-7-phosphate kinase
MIVTRTPLRISFFGGGTDYPEYFERHSGAVLATAIDKSMFFSVTKFYSELFDYSLRFAYSKVECAKSLDGIEHRPFREILRHQGISRDMEVSLAAELPSFSGTGSSSSFVVGLLNALAAYQGKFVRPMDLAYQAVEIERNVLGEHVGCQDQVLAAVGGFSLVEFRRIDDIVVHRLPLSSGDLQNLEQHLLMVFTGLRRRASVHAAKQIARVDQNVERLRQMRTMVDDAYQCLVAQRSLERFGKLLGESWNIKRQLEGSISNPTIDQLYQSALDAGAWGGKLLGAGGGGFLLFVVPPESRAAVLASLRGQQEIPIRIDAAGSQVIFAS